jgi:hypothetical protein
MESSTTSEVGSNWRKKRSAEPSVVLAKQDALTAFAGTQLTSSPLI